jgi:hypothetical protein
MPGEDRYLAHVIIMEDDPWEVLFIWEFLYEV